MSDPASCCPPDELGRAVSAFQRHAFVALLGGPYHAAAIPVALGATACAATTCPTCGRRWSTSPTAAYPTTRWSFPAKGSESPARS